MNSLRTLSRRQQRAIVLVAAILGPVAVGLLEGTAAGFRALADPATSPPVRFAAYAAWLGATSLVVLALREPVYMLGARAFLRALPIPRWQHLAADVRSIALSYSLLWLPIAHFVGKTWLAGGSYAARLQDIAVLATALAIGIATQALALQLRAGAAALLLAATVALVMAPSAGPVGAWLVLAAALLLVALALWGFYERPGPSPAHRPWLAKWASRFATATGLAGPVAWRDLRHALLLRLAILGASLAAGTAMAHEGSFCAKAGGLYIVQCAIAALVLQRVPALIDERLRETLPWLFRLPRARRRSIASAFAAMAATFVACAALAAWTWRAACESAPWARAQLTAALVYGVALALLATVALRWNEASSWIATACVLALAFILGFG